MKIIPEHIDCPDEIQTTFDWPYPPIPGDIITLSGVSYKVESRLFTIREGDYALVVKVSSRSTTEL